MSLLFNKYFAKPNSYVKNSFEIKNTITNKKIPKNFKFISLDVVSIFPNLPHNLILQALSSKWNLLHPLRKFLTKRQFIDGIKFFLDSTYIQFNNKYYKQVSGSPMGFCTSPWLADITMEILENNALKKLKSSLILSNKKFQTDYNILCKEPILLYIRFVDDCLLLVDENKIDQVFKFFNEQSEALKFTIEKESESNSISFLDLQIIRIENDFPLTNWYKKPTFSGRYINYLSHHPLSQKKP